jgi:hypothetical protein
MDRIVTPAVEASKVDVITMQKMVFVYNAVESGWGVKKVNNAYVFSKKHEGRKELYLDSYLKRFVEDNLDISGIMK